MILESTYLVDVTFVTHLLPNSLTRFLDQLPLKRRLSRVLGPPSGSSVVIVIDSDSDIFIC